MNTDSRAFASAKRQGMMSSSTRLTCAIAARTFDYRSGAAYHK